MSLFQSDFWKDYIVVILLTVILGAGLAAGASRALEAFLGAAVQALLGEAGQYDLIVHVRESSRSAAAADLPRRLAEVHPDILVREGVALAGNANFFVKLPEALYTQAALEQLAARLSAVPGFNGYSWMLEPSITVTGLRAGMRDLLALEAARLPGVRAVVRHGASLTVLLTSVEEQRAVAEALERRLSGRHIVELRWPEGAAADVEGAVRAVAERLQPRTLRDVTSAPGTGGSLERLGAELAGAAEQWQKLLEAGAAAAEAAEKLGALLDALEPALALAETPEQQGERLSEAVRSGDGADAVGQALFRVILTNVLQALAGEAAAAGGGTLPLHELRAALQALAEDAVALRQLQEEDVYAAFETLRELLPAAAGATVAELLVDEAVTPEAVAEAVREATGQAVEAYASSPGVVTPNPRGVVVELLANARRAVAGLIAVAVGLAALVLDHAAVLAAAEHMPGSRRGRPWLAALSGAALVGATYALAGGGIPYVGPGAAFVLGAALGLLVMAGARRFSPVAEEEIVAGQALGLSDGQIMREIVVPAGRPGLMTLLNARRRTFR